LLRRTLAFNNNTLWIDGSNEKQGNIEPNFISQLSRSLLQWPNANTPIHLQLDCCLHFCTWTFQDCFNV
jgi:hypothetical protein